jgi:DNA-binding transcriptional ArsR family regulator
VSQHLSVLRRDGLVRSWRVGRRVLYLRTDLATSIVDTRRAEKSGFGAGHASLGAGHASFNTERILVQPGLRASARPAHVTT